MVVLVFTLIASIFGAYLSYKGSSPHKKTRAAFIILIICAIGGFVFQWYDEQNNTSKLSTINGKIDLIDDKLDEDRKYMLKLATDIITFSVNSLKDMPQFINKDTGLYDERIKANYDRVILDNYNTLFVGRVDYVKNKLSSSETNKIDLSSISLHPRNLNDILDIAKLLLELSNGTVDKEVISLLEQKVDMYTHLGEYTSMTNTNVNDSSLAINSQPVINLNNGNPLRTVNYPIMKVGELGLYVAYPNGLLRLYSKDLTKIIGEQHNNIIPTDIIIGNDGVYVVGITR